MGGVVHTTSIETIIKHPHTKLAKCFYGQDRLVKDPETKRYFIDRDGEMFRHILNFLRNSKLVLSERFTELDLLIEEASFFEITQMVDELKHLQNIRTKNSNNSQTNARPVYCEVIALRVNHHPLDRVWLSGEPELLQELFPGIHEIQVSIYGPNVFQGNWRLLEGLPYKNRPVINFPQAVTILFNAGYMIAASTISGQEQTEQTEYLFFRKKWTTFFFESKI